VKYVERRKLEYVGRKDNQVKVRGYRIELGEIEGVMNGHEGVREGVVVVREEEDEGRTDKRLVAYVVAKAEVAGSKSIEDGLRVYLRERLPEYMIPRTIVRLDEMPLTVNGKVDRLRLPSPEERSLGSAAVYTAPRTELEQLVARIWHEVLKVEKVGLHDNFFDLGGHSIRMIEAYGKLRQALGRDFSVMRMFQYTTVSALAEYLKTQESEGLKLEESMGRAEMRKSLTKRQHKARKKQHIATGL